jgi:hypothetical protein
MLSVAAAGPGLREVGVSGAIVPCAIRKSWSGDVRPSRVEVGSLGKLRVERRETWTRGRLALAELILLALHHLQSVGDHATWSIHSAMGGFGHSSVSSASQDQCAEEKQVNEPLGDAVSSSYRCE